MKKEYHFTITRTDRLYLVTLVMLLMGWELVKFGMPTQQYALLNQTDHRLQNGSMSDSAAMEKPQTKENRTSSGQLEEVYDPTEPEPLQPLFITETNVHELMRAGLSSMVARNIIKYQEAGGKIKDKADLMKIYGMDTIQWNRAAPLIIFPEKEMDMQKIKSNHAFSKRMLDLNLATLDQLDSLPGIGLILAERIIKFRDALGGFYSVDQLQECYGLSPETIDRIKSRLHIQQTHRMVNINTADFTTLQHPYLSNKIARILTSYRQQHGPFQAADDLRHVYPPDTTWCDKLIPYLRFE